MSISALLNINQLATRKAAAELEFAVKKVHSLDPAKGGASGYLDAIRKRVESLAIEEIKKFYPEDNFLGSEIGSEINNSNITWLINAIDGEVNFINGFPHFAVSVCSLIDEIPSTAVIIDPIRREEFSASKGSGSNLNNNKIRVSSKSSISEAMISYYNSSKTDPSNNYQFDKTFDEFKNQDVIMRHTGSAALDLCYVATGRLDGIWMNGVNQIDIAAGTLVAQESGALISDFIGNPKYLNANHCICATPKCYKPILKSIQPHFKD